MLFFIYFYNNWDRYKYRDKYFILSLIMTYLGRLNANLGGYFALTFIMAKKSKSLDGILYYLS